jgi:hypothetical protein
MLDRRNKTISARGAGGGRGGRSGGGRGQSGGGRGQGGGNRPGAGPSGSCICPVLNAEPKWYVNKPEAA